MLSVNQIADILINKFNTTHSLVFKITPYGQQFYNNDLLDRDGKHYVAGVIYELPMPKISTYYTTRVREFEIKIKFLASIENDVKNIIDSNLNFKEGNNQYVLSNFIVDRQAQEQDGRGGRASVYEATIRLTVNVPTFITGGDIKVLIDDEVVEVIGGIGTFDKGLVSSVLFGNNESEINTGSEMTFRFALGSSSKVNEIFGYVLNKIYNKKFTFKIDFISTIATIDLVLRSGDIAWTNNANALEFTATFQKALPRELIQINGVNINAIAFTPQLSGVPNPINKTGQITSRINNTSKVFSIVLENNGNTVIDEIIDEWNDHHNKKFTITYLLNGRTFNTDCVLQNVVFISNENPNAIMNITMVEGEFDGYDL